MRVEVDGVWHDVELAPDREGLRTVMVDGRELELDVVHGNVLYQGRSVRYALETSADGGGFLTLDGRRLPIRLETSRRGSTSAGARAAADGAVRAPMNGTVFKVLHAVGDAVGKGEVVLVLEAMKMENEVASPIEGRIASVDVAPGQTVKPGDALFEVIP